MSIERALGYPYDIPEKSYVLMDGQLTDWSDGVDLSGRTPVLACGSNQSPTQLARKFDQGVIPVMAGWLRGYDSVYSAHFTAYGSIAATYLEQRNTRSRQMITWLDDAQLDIMHTSEALGINYDFVQMSDIEFSADHHDVITQAYAYQSIRGALCLAGEAVAIDSIYAMDRDLRAMGQADVQREVMGLLAYDGPIEDFILQNIQNKSMRKARTDMLAKTVKR